MSLHESLKRGLLVALLITVGALSLLAGSAVVGSVAGA